MSKPVSTKLPANNSRTDNSPIKGQKSAAQEERGRRRSSLAAHRSAARSAPWWGYLLFYALLIVLWQLIYMLGVSASWWKGYAFPHPLGVWESLLSLSRDWNLLRAILYSLGRGIGGFLIACVIGALLGLGLLKIRLLNRYLKPLVMGIQTLPSICWVPFAILWFGLNQQAILFVVVMGSAFGIALAVESGMRNIDPIYVKAARTMGASGFTLLRRVIFPAALPNLLSGLRQGWSFGWRALMSGEVMSSAIGLGHTLMMGRDLADINQVMLVMLIIILVGVVIDKGIFSALEEKVLRQRGLA